MTQRSYCLGTRTCISVKVGVFLIGIAEIYPLYRVTLQGFQGHTRSTLQFAQSNEKGIVSINGPINHQGVHCIHDLHGQGMVSCKSCSSASITANFGLKFRTGGTVAVAKKNLFNGEVFAQSYRKCFWTRKPR